jgi:hypothetical protein
MFIALIVAASFFSPSASTGNVSPFVPTPLGPTDFLISDAMGSHISVFDSNLVFQGFFDENLMILRFTGLDFLPNQHIVGFSQTSPPTVTEYDTSGTHISSFTSTDLHGDPLDMKSNKAPMPADFRLYVGQDAGAMADSAPEFNLSGTKIRGFGSNFYDGIAVLPGNVMWAGGLSFGFIDVFDISSGSGTGNNIAPTSTIALDNGQVNLVTMTYSAVTNTVLMVEPGSSTVFERMTDGAFVRKFIAPSGVSLTFGVTRGPGNDVFASGINGVFNGRIVRWHADGTFVSTTDISAHVFGPANIIWAGNNTAACTLTCPGNQMANTGTGATMCCAAVSFSDPLTSGTCGTVTCNPASGSCFPVGTTTVTCSESGGANCSFTVTVTDNTPPRITCPADMTALQNSASGAVVNFAPPTASDNCPGVTTACTPASGSVFPLGKTTVTCTATDASGNVASCSFQVTVVPPPTPGGSFVIGDLNAGIGSQVTFWGAQWAKSNSLSGGPAPASFKGFAESATTGLPSCGGTWTSNPGNSSGPPASIPSYIAVIASSSITKSGPTIAGNTQQVVIVKTNPGYESNPGHGGTGIVVAVICP